MSYLLPKFTPFQSSGGICYPSKDYHSMVGQSTHYEKKLDNAFMEKNNGKAYATMMGGAKKKKASSKKKKSTTTKKKSTKKAKRTTVK